MNPLEKTLDGVLEELLEGAEGSRCTLRFDDPARGWEVNFVVAEALAPGAKTLRGQGGINQRAADTVAWLMENRRLLVQPDLTNNPVPCPPAALLTAYSATAQMLAPLFNEARDLQGWISVHYVGGPRDLTEGHQRALESARSKIAALLDLPVQ